VKIRRTRATLSAPRIEEDLGLALVSLLGPDLGGSGDVPGGGD